MRIIYRIAIKDIGAFFSSIYNYIILIVCLTIEGLWCWVFPDTSILNQDFSNIDVFFSFAPYLYMIIVPAITMRLFSEEKKIGTLELLLVQPISNVQIIIGKYLAAWFIIILSILPTLIYVYSLYEISLPKGNIDYSSIAGSYMGLLLLAFIFSSIGLFTSSITDNQLFAFMTSIFINFILYYGFEAISRINVWSKYAYTIKTLGIDYHYYTLSKGMVDSRNLIYCLSLILLAFYATLLSFKIQKQ